MPSASARPSPVPPQNRPPRFNGRLFNAQNMRARNIDLAVLRPENQNPTHVTSLIDKLSEGLFREHLVVVGPAPRKPDKAVLKRMQTQRRLKLLRYLTEDMKTTKKIEFLGKERLSGVYWKAVVVEGETYKVSVSLASYNSTLTRVVFVVGRLCGHTSWSVSKTG